MTATETPVNNGVNVEALLGAREALTAAPEAAQFEWRATCEWQNGTHSNSTVEGFFGLGEEQSHRTRYSFDVDHPEIFASEDNGATPVEYVLVGLAGCLTAGVAAVAQNREIQLRKVTATIEGAMDVRGILGIDSDVRNGFSGIKVTLPHRRRRDARRHQGARRAVAEAVGRLRHHHQPHRRAGRGHLTAPHDVEGGCRAHHDRRHRGRPRWAGDEPLPLRPLDRPRGPRAERGRQLVADRAVGLAPPAHAELAVPPARATPTTATTPTGS